MEPSQENIFSYVVIYLNEKNLYYITSQTMLQGILFSIENYRNALFQFISTFAILIIHQRKIEFHFLY